MTIDTAALDAILSKAVDTGAAPGLALIVVDREGVLYSGQAGTAPDAMFRYASCTKAVASVAALQLIEQGRMALDDEVATHLPEFGKLQVLDGFDGERPILRSPSRPPLVRELLNHTSGVAYFFTDAKIGKFHELTATPTLPTGQKAALTDVPLAHDPGTIWAYGTSTDWLGLLVEAISGQALDEYVDEHICTPLGIADMTFHPDAAQEARLMPMFARMPGGELVDFEMPLPPDPEWWSGGHGLHGTAADYGRFMRAILRGGELDGARILKEETVELAFTDSLGGVPLPDGMPTADPMLSNDVPAYPFAEGWGLGFHLTLEDVPDARRAGTGDWAGLYNLYYFIDRTTGVAAMLLSQVLPFFDWPIVESFTQVEATIYAGLNAEE
ncbi:MAG TPA: serine hydrolase domain-containing protein [Aeromicrobium sp.]|nr:serine hydrolase domain-containing protein [Aeromicrobium sp.]